MTNGREAYSRVPETWYITSRYNHDKANSLRGGGGKAAGLSEVAGLPNGETVDNADDFYGKSPAKRESLSARFRRFYGRRAQPRRQLGVVLVLLFSDVLLALAVWGGALVLHDVGTFGTLSESTAVRLQEVWPSASPSQITLASILPSIVVWICARALLGLYPGYGLTTAEKLRRQTHALGVTAAIIAIFALTFHVGILLPRSLLAIGFLGLLFLAPLWLAFVKSMLIKADIWGTPVVILSSLEAGPQMVRLLQKEPTIGLLPVALFSDQNPQSETLDGVPYGGVLEEARYTCQEGGVDTAIIVMPEASRLRFTEAIILAGTIFRHVIVVPSMLNENRIMSSAVTGRDLAGVLGLEIKHNLLNPWARRTKRVMDLTLVATGGILVLPLLVALALLVRLESRGPIFYGDRRLGRNAKGFSCLKFRTMLPDAEAVLNRVLCEKAELREEYAKYHKLRDDPRVTRIGRFLRNTSLDELPQLWNVLRGEMSLVGPRPYLPRESPDIGGAQREILRVRPGITGPWQVGGRSNATFTERNQLDMYYVRNWSVWLDAVILARTIQIVLLRTGAR